MGIQGKISRTFTDGWFTGDATASAGRGPSARSDSMWAASPKLRRTHWEWIAVGGTWGLRNIHLLRWQYQSAQRGGMALSKPSEIDSFCIKFILNERVSFKVVELTLLRIFQDAEQDRAVLP